MFHFHGHGSSRLEALVLDRPAARLGLRILALDRPGIGHSDPKPGDRLLDWPNDVAEAADLLGIERFAVQGMSAGGPYALACSARFPNRIVACSLISAVPPPEISRRSGPRIRRFAWWVAYRFPNYLRRRLLEFRPDDRPTHAMVEARMARIAQWLGGEDLNLMQAPELRGILLRTLMETGRQDGAGNRAEIERLVRPWGFRIEDIRIPRMLLWHGAEDRIMTVEPARRMADRLVDCTATFYRHEGHFSVLANRAAEILGALRPL